MMQKHHECHTRQFEGCSNYLRTRARTRSPFPFTFEFLRGIFIFQRGVSRRKRPLPPADLYPWWEKVDRSLMKPHTAHKYQAPPVLLLTYLLKLSSFST